LASAPADSEPDDTSMNTTSAIAFVFITGHLNWDFPDGVAPATIAELSQ